MNQLTRKKPVGSSGCPVLDLERVRVRHLRKDEQNKLEAMVAAMFGSGRMNMGTDACILRQSTLLDQLVVNEMKLEECGKRHHKDGI